MPIAQLSLAEVVVMPPGAVPKDAVCYRVPDQHGTCLDRNLCTHKFFGQS